MTHAHVQGIADRPAAQRVQRLAGERDTLGAVDVTQAVEGPAGARVIDISGAFRLRDDAERHKWYPETQTLPAGTVYGLTEWAHAELRGARMVANPGCYPTTIQVPLIPLIEDGLLDTSRTIICDSKSGVSGAGKSPNAGTHFVEVNESLKTYNIFKHRHTPEIAQGLGIELSPDRLIFTPQLLPINRGILSTVYVKAKPGVELNDIYVSWRKRFEGRRFVRIFEGAQLPEIKFVAGTPYCDIGAVKAGDQLVIVSAEDNLLKGAASQALQNANLCFGFDEAAGILPGGRS